MTLRRSGTRSAVALVAALALSGCLVDDDGPPPERAPRAVDAVLYGIGVSSDPVIQRAQPNGFGVATRLDRQRPQTAEVRGTGWCANELEWIGSGRFIVPPRVADACGTPVVYRFAAGALRRTGRTPLPPRLWAVEWTAGGDRAAYQPSFPCGRGCIRADPRYRIFVVGGDGSGRRLAVRDALLGGWTPDGRLVFARRREVFSAAGPRYYALDLATGKATLLVRLRLAGPPVWSADRRYLAARASVTPAPGTKVSGAIVIADAGGRPVRTITSPYVISMFAWSPHGHRLAWTTSGFPNPHQLFVLDEPRATPNVAFATGARHFDWVTWSPDGRWLLVDDEHAAAWRLVPSRGAGAHRIRPRLGGRPVWCCPVGPFATG